MTDLLGAHLVETEWLAKRAAAPDLVVLDGSWHLPAANRNARAEYTAEHIPGALYFDIDEVSDKQSPLPHILRPPDKLANNVQELGIEDCMLKSTSELRRAFEAAGIDVTKSVVTSCGSGVSAAILGLGLALLGRPDAGLYDGSWTDWGREDAGTKIETGSGG